MKKRKIAKILQYTAVFQPDEEASGYTVTIPALPGCISEGDTFEEAKKNIEEAASLYLEVMKNKKEETPDESNVIIAPIQVQI